MSIKYAFSLVLAAALLASIAVAQQQKPAGDDPVQDSAGTKVGSASKATIPLLHPPTYDKCMADGRPVVTRKDIYHDGWIDLNKNGKNDIYEDSAQPEDKRLDNLIGQMTVEEKTAQCATLYGYTRVLKDYLPTENWNKSLWKDGIANIDEQLNGYYYHNKDVPGAKFLLPPSKHTWAINETQRFFIEDTRLGIPVEFTDEGIRGLEYSKATCFPTQLGLGQTWNRKLIRRVGEVTGREAYALGYDNVYAPIMDVMRDPRWGRCLESYGEDPFLVSELGIAMVQGMRSQGIVSTLKHYAIYSDNKGAREGYARTDPRCSLREAEEIHLWPFERVIRAAGPLGIMCSYNDYDSIPIAGSSYYLIDVLRKRMGFEGYVVSDSGAVEDLEKKHKVAYNYKEAVRQTIMAGLNVRTAFNVPDTYVKPLRELVAEGAVPMEVLNSRVRDVLRVKMREGLFNRPYRPLKEADAAVMAPKHIEAARQASRESLVLLKNEKNVLPLDSAKIKIIAVCGPNAENVKHSLGRYGPGDAEIITVRQALEKRLAGKAKVLYSLGADFFDENWPDTEILWDPPTEKEQKLIDEAVVNARQADVAIIVVGDQYNGVPGTRATVGENASRTGIMLTGRQDDLIRAVAATGKPTIVVNISGRPTSLIAADRFCPAILQAFFPGAYGGEAIVDVLFGDYNPGGKLTCTFPKTTGQLELNFPTKPLANSEQTAKDRVSVTGVLWPFGHGLSYTQFEYSDLAIEPKKQSPDGNITISFKVTNKGQREGDEIVQLYLHDEVSSVTTWEQILRGFDRIHLKSGESKTVTFTVFPEYLELLNVEMKRVVEPGTFKVMVGASSTDIRLEGKFEIEGKTPDK
jgi:beta-glucosidase